jgi:hypothetical protein
VRLPIPPPGHIFKLKHHFNGTIQRVNGHFNDRFIAPTGLSGIESSSILTPVLPILRYSFETSSNEPRSLTHSHKKQSRSEAALLLNLGAQERTRTSTVLPPLGPEPSASTNFATWAGVCTAETAIIATASKLSSISRKPPADRAGRFTASAAASIDTPLGAQYGC